MGNLIAKVIGGILLAPIIYGISKWEYDQCTRVKDAMKEAHAKAKSKKTKS